jgi:hypothetical protein
LYTRRQLESTTRRLYSANMQQQQQHSTP